MELKVWCDGIQRVVCGASASTTCQDIVFALAHATGQTGRFILIEKWRNNERVLAPTDRPLTSLAKWGEYANDVTFVMKRSGDVSTQSKQNKLLTLPGKKSDSELIHKRKVLISSLINANYSDKHNTDKCIPTSNRQPTTTETITHYQSATLPLKSKPEPFVRSISFHKANNPDTTSSHFEGQNGNYTQIYSNPSSELRQNLMPQRSQTSSEPLYATLSKNRPPQPPPYKEAITKSTLFSPGTSSNGIYGYSGSILNNKDSFTPSQAGANVKPIVRENQMAGKNSNNNMANSYSPNRTKSLSSLHQDTVNLIGMQQQTMKSQEKDIVKMEQELDFVQSKLSENELIVKRYKDEMELYKKLWLEQEALIEKLEAENMEEELNNLLDEAKKYQGEISEVNKMLSNCDSEVCRCREEIGNLRKKIENTLNESSTNGTELENVSLVEHLHKTLQEKTKEIDTQNCDLNELNASLERLDKTIQDKNDLIDKLTIEIKDANVEGLSLQTSALYVEERHTPESESVAIRVGSNRKIPALPRELGNTVPTKKNPDGIWV